MEAVGVGLVGYVLAFYGHVDRSLLNEPSLEEHEKKRGVSFAGFTAD